MVDVNRSHGDGSGAAAARTVLVPAALTPERLTAVLRAGGHLARGRVESLEVEASRPTVLSIITRLRAVYSPETADPPPARLFLKSGRADVDPVLAQGGRREVAFYQTVAPQMVEGMAIRCYAASYDATTNTFHVLLEDLGDTHVAVTEWPLPPALDQCERIIDLWARFHASWWDDPRLGTAVGTFTDDIALRGWLQNYERRFAAFADRLGDRLPAPRRRVYERAIASGDRLLTRYRSRRHLTIRHGDAHMWNVLYPRDPAAHGLRLFDWDSWTLDVGAEDLAYMMAVHWYPERRRRLEWPLLRRYHDGLGRHGVNGYSFEMLCEDYRLSVIWMLSVPVFQSSRKLGPWIWWAHLERILLAFDDLGCEDLLD